MYDSTLLIVGYSLEFEDDSNTITFKDLQLNFPSDTELYGVVKFGEDASESSIRSILQVFIFYVEISNCHVCGFLNTIFF